MNILHDFIPKQKRGSKTNATATAKSNTDSRHSAFVLFSQAKNRLLDINNWYKLCGKSGAEFYLTDNLGNPTHSLIPKVGNLIRIKLPAPRNKTCDGYDWVEIEKFIKSKDVYNDVEAYGFRVRPTECPIDKSHQVAHFYNIKATSSFMIYRKSETVYVMERGRNERPNISGSVLNKLRSILISLPGMIGFSNPQWKKLVNGILYNKS